MPHKLESLIQEGEHQQQDFKFRVDDSKKIARSLSAFANTDGGRLLIGVKDNGKIAGVKSDEEIHMVETAALMYTKPEVNYEAQLWEVNGKTVLEVWVDPSDERPHKSPDDNGKWKTFVRREDKIVSANGVLLKVWKQEKREKGTNLTYTDTEKALFDLIELKGAVTFMQFCKAAKISKNKAETILARLVAWDVIAMDLSEKGCKYQFGESF